MSDFLTRLAGRVLGTAPVLRPWTPSRFEAGPGLDLVEQPPVDPDFVPLAGGHAERVLDAEPLEPHPPGPPLPSPPLPPGEGGRARRGIRDEPSRHPEGEPREPEGSGWAELSSPQILPVSEAPRRRDGEGTTSRHPEAEPREPDGSGWAELSSPQILQVTEAPRRMTARSLGPEAGPSPVQRARDLRGIENVGGGAPLPVEGRAMGEGSGVRSRGGDIRNTLGELAAVAETPRPAPASSAPAPGEPLSRAAPPRSAEEFSLTPRFAHREDAVGPRQDFPLAAWTADDRAEPEPTIEITIGRIEVKAPPHPPAPPARPARPGPRISLNEYLRRRREGR
jgi:hypothetical protein